MHAACSQRRIASAAERAQEIKEKIQEKDKDISVLSVSILNNIGMKALQKAIIQLADKIEGQQAAADQDGKPAASSFMAERESIDDDAEVQYPGSEN